MEKNNFEKKEFDKQKCSLLKIKTRKTIWTKDIELTKKIQQRQIITFNTWFSSTSHLTRTSARFNFNGTSLLFTYFTAFSKVGEKYIGMGEIIRITTVHWVKLQAKIQTIIKFVFGCVFFCSVSICIINATASMKELISVINNESNMFQIIHSSLFFFFQFSFHFQDRVKRMALIANRNPYDFWCVDISLF